MNGFDVEVGALRSDARAWDQAAQELAAPVAAIRPLTLGPNDIPILGNTTGLNASYEKARGNVERLMEQAATYFERIGDALLAVASEYEGTEQVSAYRFEQGDR